MRFNGRWILAVVLTGAAGWQALAQDKKPVRDAEGRVRAAAFGYYSSTIFGDADEHMKAARMPIQIIRDGAVTQHDEKATRALLARIVARYKAQNLTADDQKRITANMIAVFDDAAVQFIGANTATLTFLIHQGEGGSGDSLGLLVLHRKEEHWLVIQEITDSAPIPPAYLLDLTKP